MPIKEQIEIIIYNTDAGIDLMSIVKASCSVQHRQEIGGDICLTTPEKKETFDLKLLN